LPFSPFDEISSQLVSNFLAEVAAASTVLAIHGPDWPAHLSFIAYRASRWRDDRAV
jgi:hypothetical protein